MSRTRKICRAVKVRYVITLLAMLALVTFANFLVASTRGDISAVAHSYLSNFTLLKHIIQTDTASRDHQSASSGAKGSQTVLSGQKPVGNIAGNVTSKNDTAFSQSSIGDQKFLDKLLVGHWSLRNYTTRELGDVETFINRTRAYLKLPPSLQRSDNTCGNVNFPGHQWYRAVCNPKGATPCCINGSCVDKPVQECRCPECYDMRQQIHAELATWVPDGLTVKLFVFFCTDVCPLLRNRTIYLVGDSYMRQLYIALLAVLRDKNPRHVLKDDVSEVSVGCPAHVLHNCIQHGADLMQIDVETIVLMIFNHFSMYTVRTETLNEVLKELKGKRNSWVLLGIGFHDHLDFESLRNHVLNPMISMLSKSSWPKVIWLPIHSPGLLKTPLVETQTARAILAFNAKVKAHLDAQPITLLDFTKLTNGTMSYDGSHYGRGVNEVKIQVLLNYFREIDKTVKR
ncbi:unnamed protein product [Lymnaea stagnalis]|uniref:Uncharacterized protein n=1 Tax=Lymnaea stagnalis TaxID=6523 RepID=A0AAV2IU47_LYMST